MGVPRARHSRRTLPYHGALFPTEGVHVIDGVPRARHSRRTLPYHGAPVPLSGSSNTLAYLTTRHPITHALPYHTTRHLTTPRVATRGRGERTRGPRACRSHSNGEPGHP